MVYLGVSVALKNGPPINRRLHNNLKRCALNALRFSLLLDAIEAIGVIRRLRIGQVEEVAYGCIGADGRPIDEIGRRLQNIITVDHAGKAELELPVPHKRRRVEMQRLDEEQRAGGHAVVEVGFKCVGRDRGITGQDERRGIKE